MKKISRYSIRKQYTAIFCLLLAGSFLVVSILGFVTMPKMYMYQKERSLLAAYKQIEYVVNNGGIESDDFDTKLKNTASVNNVEILIIDSEAQTVKTTVPNARFLTQRLLSYIFKGPENVRVIYEDSRIQIQRTDLKSGDLDYLELWGVLANNNLILMRSPIQSMREAAFLANLQMLIMGIVASLIGFLIILIISKRLTRPIMDLVNISSKITKLDFSEKYKQGSGTEIDVLGEHINSLSQSLEKTILELKTANAELQQDIKKRTEIDEIRKDFVSNVSHELKTPIALIQGYAEGLKDCVADDEESREFYCDVIIDEAARMNKLVRNLLDLSMLEFGGNTLDMQHFDINELIYNCSLAFDLFVKNNNINLILPEKSESIYVWADEFKVEQIFNNYLSNAIHYAKNDKVVKVSFEKNEDNLRINVYNSGDNIDEEVIPKLWTKFYKVDKARTREYGGSGIGLSIVKAGMELMGHEYGVYNVEGGVVFWFELDAKACC